MPTTGHRTHTCTHRHLPSWPNSIHPCTQSQLHDQTHISIIVGIAATWHLYELICQRDVLCVDAHVIRCSQCHERYSTGIAKDLPWERERVTHGQSARDNNHLSAARDSNHLLICCRAPLSGCVLVCVWPKHIRSGADRPTKQPASAQLHASWNCMLGRDKEPCTCWQPVP